MVESTSLHGLGNQEGDTSGGSGKLTEVGLRGQGRVVPVPKVFHVSFEVSCNRLGLSTQQNVD